ncbi:MAG: hypothetical protein HYV35_05795 [Lentisphaerae bacterium]|nr:hypothetical protein [Lentisphaerota bacterium]
MLTKQQIIKTIRRMSRRREPLNITAVKRSHPELIEAVYTVKPFWGWKQALKDARINYARIRVELQEYLTCEICGKDCRHLANHVILKHGVTTDEYLMDYPDAELVCEDMRAKLLQTDAPPIRHWEPCWSREYVLDRTAEYHRRGYPMHTGKFSDIDNSLILAANRFLGGWNEALIAVGLDPRKLTQEAYRQMHIYRDKESIIQGIRQRLKERLPLHRAALNRRDERTKGHVSLLKSGIEFFGSWDNALKAAGVDPEVVRKAKYPKRKYATRFDLIHEIRARHRRKWPISHGEIFHGKKQDGALGVWAWKYFGSWNNALKAAGFDPVEIRRQFRLPHRRYPGEEAVLKAMRQRNKEGRFMNYHAVEYGSDRDQALLRRTAKLFGSWNNALRKIGLDPEKIKRDARRRCARKRAPQYGRYPDEKSVLQAMKQRIKEGRFMNYDELHHKADRDQALLCRASKFFGSWNNALRKIGLDPEKIKYDAMHRAARNRALQRCQYPDKEAVLQAMKQRNKEGRFMNYDELFYKADPNPALLRRAHKFFGSWNNALRKIGLDPEKIKRDARQRGVSKRYPQYGRYPDKESVLKAIKQRNKEGCFMNLSGLVYGADRDRALLRKAHKFFGSWNNALKKTGFDPEKIKYEARHRAGCKPGRHK